MSRVAKAQISLPSQVEVVNTNGQLTIKGPKGSLAQCLNKNVKMLQKDENNSKILEFRPLDEKKPDGWMHAGTARSLVNNMVKGVTQGFTVTLELVGVGYRVQSGNHKLTLSLGYSHPIEYKLPEQVRAETPSQTVIALHSIDKQLIGQVAAEIRALRPPEPYKGKGVRYAGEIIIKKEAKKK
ncbi:MAG: 50S ribosomal protein L6 [Legionellales bacterium RIFCSPHIGHO2_12_FULL_37_14]|nr:MAG: 50S ribosomal protein L6 [Legionellales bacterium RIFCSPHIGHO2_12_FULL_37_14]